MKPLLTRDFAIKHVLDPLKNQFEVGLVGSLSKEGGTSYNDVDLVMFYHNSNTDEIPRFLQLLESLGWVQSDHLIDLADNPKAHYYSMKVNDQGKVFDVYLDIYFQQYLSEGLVIDDERFKPVKGESAAR